MRLKIWTGINLIGILLFFSPVFADTLVASYTTHGTPNPPDYGGGSTASNINEVGECFTTPNDGNSYPLTEADFWIKKVAGTCGNVTAVLKTIGAGSCGSNAKPGAFLASSTPIDASGFTTSFVQHGWTFDGTYTMAPNTAYFVTTYNDNGDNTCDLQNEDNVGGTFAGNRAIHVITSGVWNVTTANVFLFKVFGTTPTPSPVVNPPMTVASSTSYFRENVYASEFALLFFVFMFGTMKLIW